MSEHEYALMQEQLKKAEQAKANLPKLLALHRQIIEAYDAQEADFKVYIREQQTFLESLPARIQKRLDADREILRLRKQIASLLKSTEE